MSSKLNSAEHKNFLTELPKLFQSVEDMEFIFTPLDFRLNLLKRISCAQKRICIVTLYLEKDEGGRNVLLSLYQAKRRRQTLDVSVLVDWHRARRGRIGASKSSTNADWYRRMAKENSDAYVPIYGVPVNTSEALGVLHFKGFIIDDWVLYSGASLNSIYLHQHEHGKYRYDRYHLIRNKKMSDIMFQWVQNVLAKGQAANRLDCQKKRLNHTLKKHIRLHRKMLRTTKFEFKGNSDNTSLSVTPLVGLGKKSTLNKAIYHLIACTRSKLTLCTPYFNLPKIIVHSLTSLLQSGKYVEAIIGDKTANDFYLPEDKSFKMQEPCLIFMKHT